MGCQIHSLNPQLLYRTLPHSSRTKQLSLCFSSYNNLSEENSISTATIKQTSEVYNVNFKTLGSCKLGISRYPDFEYNAAGGKGSGTGTRILESDLNNEVSVDFDVETVYIPPLSTATTKFLGLPLPPFLKIDIVPEVFQGKINQESGKVDLKFKAKFLFSVGSIYKAPPLLVETVLTSEESKGEIRNGRGEKLNEDRICRLVGVAKVEPINDFFMDTFLSLPTECLADLNAIISFSTTV
ncbi:hypothetical protein ACJIZ3_009238 [Penstemon smallii]|uniref:Uncharacterized protein n=1 Tax=Penstemon smallii TaxID=265156 RepID=A0ABD3TDX1_9LAMI